jgi:hypothetical protein
VFEYGVYYGNYIQIKVNKIRNRRIIIK